MTDEEMAKADAEYAALRGTKPDGWSFVSRAELEANPISALATRRANWTDMKWQRFTVVEWPEAGVWIEVWKERPRKEAPFDPPLVAA